MTSTQISASHRCMDTWRLKTRENNNVTSSSSGDQLPQQFSSAYYYSEQPLVAASPASSQPRHQLKFSEKPFLARADYISADYIKNNPHRVDLDYLNYVRLEIEVPYLEGTVPLVSTQPLQQAHNLRHLLNGNESSSRYHVCSNFANFGQVKFGFLRGEETSFKEGIYFFKKRKF